MDRSLDDLSARFKPLAEQLLANIKAAGIDILIVDTLRTAAQQADAISRGVSWTTHSKHLTGDAIDLAPLYQGSNKVDWDASDPVWLKMGELGEDLGLTWGGRWPHRDMGHFEYREG